MATHRISARPPRGAVRAPLLQRDPEAIARVLEDAAHFPGGTAEAVAVPTSEAEVASLLRSEASVLAVGAQSSLTGGATPVRGVVLVTSGFGSVSVDGTGCVEVGAGVTLDALQLTLAGHGRFYPPVPTYTGATCGGVVATNAAGPATFKYGSTRPWVRALTVVLPSGDVLDLQRGETIAHPDGYFEIALSEGVRRIPVPPLPLPDVPKCSAGYFCARGMDLVDLFIGAEGTLGVVVSARLATVARPAARCLALVPMPSQAAALALVGDLREAATAARASGDPCGPDVAAIEHMDRRSLALLREDGHDRRVGLAIDASWDTVLIVDLELPRETDAAAAWHEVESSLDTDAPDTPLGRFCRLLARAGALDDTTLALPGDTKHAEQFVALREAVPTAVNQRIALARTGTREPIAKTAGDFIVPMRAFDAMMTACDRAFRGRGLDYAVWGHVSDGNIHPNVLPRSLEEAHRGEEAVLEIGREVIALGGSPLAEHGVGRHPVKQRLLHLLHGDAGLAAMRAIKRAMDPSNRLAPGVLFDEGAWRR